MPNTTVVTVVCAVCGHPAQHKLRLMIDGSALRIWNLCTKHAQTIAEQDYAIQFEPNWGGKWLYGKEEIVKQVNGHD